MNATREGIYLCEGIRSIGAPERPFPQSIEGEKSGMRSAENRNSSDLHRTILQVQIVEALNREAGL